MDVGAHVFYDEGMIEISHMRQYETLQEELGKANRLYDYAAHFFNSRTSIYDI